MINMRKTTLIVAVVAGLAMAALVGLGTSTQTALADAGPHVDTGADSTPDKCASCHRIHTAQNEYLLKEAGSVEDFCYSCHGTGGPGSDLAVQEGTLYGGPYGDPYGSKAANAAVGLRAGGFDFARIDTTDPSTRANPNPDGSRTIGVGAREPVVSNHAIDGTVGTMWGSGAINSGAGPSVTLDCGSCHNPHGNGNYRILRDVPTGSTGAGYAIPDNYPKADGSDYATDDYMDMYLFGGVSTKPGANPATDPPPAGESILWDTSNWCSQCHTRYLASGGKPGAEGSRVDSGDAIFTYRHTSSGLSLSSRGLPPGSDPIPMWKNRACITCHASHGSNAEMPGTDSSSVPWPGQTVYAENSNDPQRASLLKMDNRGICLKCHAP